jgi:undecaprenyl diphosphate synthase
MESKALLDIYGRYIERLIGSEDIHKNRVRVRFIGRWEEQFPESLKQSIHRCIEVTKEYESYFLNFFLAYSGDDEMRQAIKEIVMELNPGEAVTDKMIKEHLMTRELPPVDLLIRTGGEPHLSAGFMMWDIADSQLYFSEAYYPDFGEEAFREALREYIARSRRFGK